jgi:hypothetical protein
MRPLLWFVENRPVPAVVRRESTKRENVDWYVDEGVDVRDEEWKPSKSQRSFKNASKDTNVSSAASASPKSQSQQRGSSPKLQSQQRVALDAACHPEKDKGATTIVQESGPLV